MMIGNEGRESAFSELFLGEGTLQENLVVAFWAFCFLLLMGTIFTGGFPWIIAFMASKSLSQAKRDKE